MFMHCKTTKILPNTVNCPLPGVPVSILCALAKLIIGECSIAALSARFNFHCVATKVVLASRVEVTFL